jgi:AAHS family benzoate transporter-like MFS transporter
LFTFLIFLGGASTVGAMNLGNPYIIEFYLREICATGMPRRLGILAPTLIAMLLVTGIDPKMAFATFAVPSILAALGIF